MFFANFILWRQQSVSSPQKLFSRYQKGDYFQPVEKTALRKRRRIQPADVHCRLDRAKREDRLTGRTSCPAISSPEPIAGSRRRFCRFASRVSESRSRRQSASVRPMTPPPQPEGNRWNGTHSGGIRQWNSLPGPGPQKRSFHDIGS